MTLLQTQSTTIGGRLKDARMLAGLTTRDIAPLVQVAQRTVSNWENDKGEPGVTQLILWARATGQTPAALIEGLSPETTMAPAEAEAIEGLSQHSVRPKRLELPTFCSVAVKRFRRHVTRRSWTSADDIAFRAYAVTVLENRSQ